MVENKPILDKIQAEATKLKIEESKALTIYKIQVLGLQLILVGLVFSVAFWQWKRLKLKNSPHTIIWSTVVGAQGILMTSVIGCFVWDFIPHRMMKRILAWISDSDFLQYTAYLVYMLLPIIFLGTIVWWIQKKLFAPGLVAARRLNKSECPDCSFKLNGHEQTHCPRCSHKVRMDCKRCEDTTYSDLAYCEKCGEDPHTES